MGSGQTTEPVNIYNQSIAALNRGAWSEAYGLAKKVDAMVPNHPGVQFVAGVASLELRQMQEAIDRLQRAVKLNPARADYAAQFARALVTARFFREAQEMADIASMLAPQDAMTLDTLGVVYSQANAYAKAADTFRRAAALMPGRASYRFNLATSLTYVGEIEAAEAEYEACIAIDPRYWKAHLALSQLRKQTTERNHLPRLEALLHDNVADAGGQLYVNLALSKESEDLKEYEQAFNYLVAGKSSHGKARGYASANDAALFESIMAAVPDRVESIGGHGTREPIFVIGMPRSGTTLVERIISSHSQVISAGELQNFSVALKYASGSVTSEMLDVDTIRKSHRLDWLKLGAAYLESTRPATGGKPHFIDKLPHNFLYAGFIAKAMPNAKIICLRRDPLDTCLSNFRQLFALTSPYYDYSFDLLDTGRYYLLFDKLMRHWDTVMPGKVLQLDYEALVQEQESSTRRLLSFCELPWEDACLRFEQNEAPVATASAVQVRDPINRSYMRRWERYREQLQPLREVLVAGGIKLPD